MNSILGLNLADTDSAIWSGPNGGLGNTQCNLFYPAQSVMVNSLAYYCTQTGSVSGAGVKVGIYDGVTGLLLGESLLTVIPGAGGQFVDLISPITLTKGKAYYLAISCNENGARFLISSNKWNGAGLPSVSFEIPNLMVPGNATLYFPNKRSTRYTVGAF